MVFLLLLLSPQVVSPWDPMDCNTPGFPVPLSSIPHPNPLLTSPRMERVPLQWESLPNSQSFPKFMFIESMMPSNNLILCHPLRLLPSIFPSTRSFPMSWLFISGGQSIGSSASVSPLPMNIQGWFSLGLTSLIFLQTKGFSRVFSNTTVLCFITNTKLIW